MCSLALPAYSNRWAVAHSACCLVAECVTSLLIMRFYLSLSTTWVICQHVLLPAPCKPGWRHDLRWHFSLVMIRVYNGIGGTIGLDRVVVNAAHSCSALLFLGPKFDLVLPLTVSHKVLNEATFQ